MLDTQLHLKKKKKDLIATEGQERGQKWQISTFFQVFCSLTEQLQQ